MTQQPQHVTTQDTGTAQGAGRHDAPAQPKPDGGVAPDADDPNDPNEMERADVANGEPDARNDDG